MEYLRQRLGNRIHMDDIMQLCLQAEQDVTLRQHLYDMLYDEDKQSADNAAWVMTHFREKAVEWLSQYQNQLIDAVMLANDTTRRRLLLTILEQQSFCKENVRTDFLDFCLSRIFSHTEAVGVRSLCTKLSFRQCCFYPELLEELKTTLDMLDDSSLSPGLLSAKKQVIRRMAKKGFTEDRTER